MRKPILYHCTGKANMNPIGCYGLFKTLDDAVGAFRKEETLTVLSNIFAVFEDASEVLVPDNVYLRRETKMTSASDRHNGTTYIGEFNVIYVRRPEEVRKNEEAWLASLENKLPEGKNL